MNTFNKFQLINENCLENDSLNSLADKTIPSKTERILQVKRDCDNKINEAKYKYYRSVLESGNNKYIIEKAKKVMESTIDKINSQKESFIHGIEVDSDSIFDNGVDDGTFNRTEWMDLTLEAFYDYDKNINNIKLQEFVKEAQILLSENSSFDEIVELQEAVVSKVKVAIDRVIQAIKRIFAKFSEKLTVIGKNQIPYLKKYKSTILEQQPKSEIVKIKDFETALKRIMNTSVPNLNYSDIKNAFNNNNEDLDNDAMDNIIFEKIKSNIPEMNNIKIAKNSSIADYCKTFFCFGEQATLLERDMRTFNMTDIYNFLFDANKIINKIKSDINGLTSNANMIISAADKEINLQNTNEAFSVKKVYSSVLESYITEFEVSSNENNNTNNNNQTQNNSNTMDKRMNNVNGDKFKNQDDATENLNKAKGPSDKIKNEVSSYIRVCQTILAAKMTSVEFFQKELFSLVRHHVGNFIEDETNQKPAQTGTL